MINDISEKRNNKYCESRRFLRLVVSALALLIFVCGCKTYSVSGWNRSLNVQNDFGVEMPITGSEKLLEARKSITVRAIQSGELEVPLSGALNLKHPACETEANETLHVPVYAYLLKHDKFGYFLIDTGTCAFYTGEAYGPMKGYLIPRVMVKTILKSENESIGVKLLQHVDSLNRINAVFFTHLHFDHTSGLPDLPRPLLLVAGKGEGIPEIPWLIEPKHFAGEDHVNMLDFQADYAKDSELGRVIDIFGDGTLWAVSTPGHTKGHVYNEPGKLNTDFDLKKWIPSHTTKEGGQVNEQKARKRFQSKSSN